MHLGEGEDEVRRVREQVSKVSALSQLPTIVLEMQGIS